MKKLSLIIPVLFCCWACNVSKTKSPTVVVPPSVERDTFLVSNDSIANTANFNYWRHHPIHPKASEEVSFRLGVSDSKGIRQVELWLFEYELYRNQNGLPSKRRRPLGAWGVVQTWESAGDKDLQEFEFIYESGFPNSSNIDYIFRVINTDGQISEELGSFDAGDSPWPKDKILLYGATEASLDHTINICFFQDTDYLGDWDQFIKDLDTLIYQGFHKSNVVASNKKRWRFYYTQTATDGYALSQDFGNPDRYPAFMRDTLIYGIDAFGLLHRQPYSDGAYMAGNIHFLSHNVFTSESYNLGTAVHETAHSVFNLSDEYEGCACFEAPEGGSNMFRDLAACESFNEQNRFSDPSCSTITSYHGQKWFMPERSVYFPSRETCIAFCEKEGYGLDSCFMFIDLDGQVYHRAEQGVCIMQDDGDRQVRRFQRTCRTLIENYYERLPSFESRGERLQVKSLKDNMFQYEPVVLMELSLVENEWKIKPVGREYGIPKKNLIDHQDIQMKVMGKKGNTTYALSMDRPDCLHFEGGTKDSLAITNYGKICLAIPDQKGIDKVLCQMKEDNSLKEPIEHVFKIKSAVKKLKY